MARKRKSRTKSGKSPQNQKKHRMAYTGEIQRGRDRKFINCRKLSQIVVTSHDERHHDLSDVLCQWNKETKIVIKCRTLSCTPLCATSVSALRPPTSHSRAHAAHWDSLGTSASCRGCRSSRPGRFGAYTQHELARLLGAV